MNREDVVRRAWRLFEPELAEQGYELVELEFAGTGGSGARVLRMFIDKADGGVTHEDCVAATQVVNPLLDVEDFVPGEYMLEVSSPGLDRPVRKPEDFVRFSGEEVRLTTHLPLDGRRRFTGELRGFADGLIAIACDGRVYEIHIENLKKANLNR